jgi:hypothetical protein
MFRSMLDSAPAQPSYGDTHQHTNSSNLCTPSHVPSAGQDPEVLACCIEVSRKKCKRRPGRVSSSPYLPVPLSPGVGNTCIFSKATIGRLLNR